MFEKSKKTPVSNRKKNSRKYTIFIYKKQFVNKRVENAGL